MWLRLIIDLRVFVDQVNDTGPREEDFPNLKKLEGKWMANLGCLVSIDRDLQTRNKQAKVCPISIIYFVWPVFKVTEVAG